MPMEPVYFIAVPVGMAIFGWLYKQWQRSIKRCDEIEERFNKKLTDMHTKLIEEYVKRAELDRLILEVNSKIEGNQLVFIEAVNHLREDFRVLTTHIMTNKE